MYMTAPMGVMQQVQPPLTQTPSFLPQVAPAAQRILASAVSSTTPVPVSQSDRKQEPAANARPLSALPSGAVMPDDVTPEIAKQTTQSLLATLPQTKPTTLNAPNNAGFAAQLLAQEDMAEVALPQTSNIADILKQVADRKAPLPEAPARTQAPSEPIQFATPPASTVNTVMRRETQGAVMVPRGTAAYAQAQWRMQRSETLRPAEQEEIVLEPA